MARFDAATSEPTRDTIRNCYDRIMAYGNRHQLTPWFYQ